MSYDLDLSHPTGLRATMAREGLMFSQLLPWWSPDTDSQVDPLDDLETRQAVRAFMSSLWDAALTAEAAIIRAHQEKEA